MKSSCRLMLVYVAEQFLASMSLGLLKNPEGFGFPGSRNLQQYPSAHNADLIAGSGMHWGVVAALIAVIFAYVLLTRTSPRLCHSRHRRSAACRAVLGVNPARLVLFCLGASGLLAGLAGMFEVAGPAGQVTIDFNVGYGFTAIIVAFLGRLHPVGILLAGLLMALTYIGGDIAQSNLGLPAAAIQVFQGCCCFSCSPLTCSPITGCDLAGRRPRNGPVSHQPRPVRRRLLIAATPLIFAAIGELVVGTSRRSEPRRRGDDDHRGDLRFCRGRRNRIARAGLCRGGGGRCGAQLAVCLSDPVTLANQVASGLALTLFGLGISALMGQSYVGMKPPRLGDINFGPLAIFPWWDRSCSPMTSSSILACCWSAATWAVLKFTRAGLILRAVGESHDAAHALGYKVMRIRTLAIMFGGACAGVGGAYISLIRVPQWTEGMTAGVGWIALALVVFASWKPWRLLLGAYLFGGITQLQLNLQGAGVAIPVEYLAMSPYVITIIVLVILSADKSPAPASLGRTFHASQ